ncbi:MAG: hypothetical protein MZV64_34430 [Ignavibacteriales bacterium]|nr:hypothetical protein [Ignavibacteriales bacterium]
MQPRRREQPLSLFAWRIRSGIWICLPAAPHVFSGGCKGAAAFRPIVRMPALNRRGMKIAAPCSHRV